MKKGDIVQIEWLDAFSLDSWMEEGAAFAAIATSMLCHTVGFFLAESEESISVCHTYNKDNQVCGVMSIPKRCMIEEPKILSS
jgi:hypothetical protein